MRPDGPGGPDQSRLWPDQHRRDSPGWLVFLRRLLGRLNPVRGPRTAPRVIKSSVPKWRVKRGHHAAWPQPQHPPDSVISRT